MPELRRRSRSVGSHGSAEDITALPRSRELQTSPHLRPATKDNADIPYDFRLYSSNSRLNTPTDRLQPEMPDKQLDRLSRSPSALKRFSRGPTSKTLKKRKPNPQIREEEIRAMSAPVPRPLVRPDSGILRRDSKKIRDGLNRRFERPMSHISLPRPDSGLPARSAAGDGRSYRISIADIMSPRPLVRASDPYSMPAVGWSSMPHPEKATRRIHLGKDPLRPAHPNRVEEAADELDASELRAVLERDKRRKERKRAAEAEKLKRRLERRTERERDDEMDDAVPADAVAVTPPSSRRRGDRLAPDDKAQQQHLPSPPRTPVSPISANAASATQVGSAEYPKRTSSLANRGSMPEHQEDAEALGMDDMLTSIAYLDHPPPPSRTPPPVPRDQDVSLKARAEALSALSGTAGESLSAYMARKLNDDKFDAESEKIPQIPLFDADGSDVEETPELSPMGATFAADFQSALPPDITIKHQDEYYDAPAVAVEPTKRASPPSPSADQKKKRRPSRFLSFFRRGDKRKRSNSEATAFSGPQTGFRNESREEMQRRLDSAPSSRMGTQQQQQQPTFALSPSSRTQTPIRSQSKFLEDLPDVSPDYLKGSGGAHRLPSPPSSRLGSPSPRMALPADVIRSALMTPISHHRISEQSELAPDDDLRKHDSKSPMRVSDPPAAAARSLASVDSEGSWLTGKPARRSLVQAGPGSNRNSDSHRAAVAVGGSPALEGGDVADDEYFRRLNAGSAPLGIHPEGSHKASSEAVGKASTDDDGGAAKDGTLRVYGQLGRQPDVSKGIRVQSSEGLLREMLAGGDDDSAGEEQATPGTGTEERRLPTGDSEDPTPGGFELQRATSVKAQRLLGEDARIVNVKRTSGDMVGKAPAVA
jgi:hypothetical protein